MMVKLEEYAFEPTRAHKTDAGLDLYAPNHVIIGSLMRKFVDTGVHIQLPKNTVGYIRSKSGLLKNDGIITDGVIDEGYTGSIGVTLINTSMRQVEFFKGQKIAQLVIQPVIYEDIEITDALGFTDRGDNGFGSTGR